MRFIESIAIKDGVAELLSYHQARMDYTYQHFFQKNNPHDLSELIQTVPESGLYKFRVVYDEDIQEITSERYLAKPIRTLELVEGSGIDYSFKYEDRSALDELYHSRSRGDDIIIVQNGLITDSYYANLAFWDGERWVTPTNPLLKGTRRQFLLNAGTLYEQEITVEQPGIYQKMCLINAMIDLGEVEIDIAMIKTPSSL